MMTDAFRKRVALEFCVVATLFVAGGAIFHRHRRVCVVHVVVDKLECYVNVGFGEPPCNVYPGVARPNSTTPNATVKVWLRAVYSESSWVPIRDREITLDVVDSFGRHVEGPDVLPAKVMTRPDGFAAEPVVLKLNGHAGVFRIRAKYDDKLARSFSYSPPLIVLTARNQ